LYPQVSGGVEITITHLIDQDAWMIEYELPERVQELTFVRNQSAFRSTSWELSEGDVEFGRKGEYEIVRGLDGEPFDNFSIVAPSLPQLLPKDYSQNYLFTDGSNLLFTGHFIVAENTTDPVEYSLRLTPAKSEGIVVRGRYYDDTATITDPGDNGLFAYFGALEPLQNDNYIAVLDPGLPDWLVRLLPEYLPRLFDFYASRLGDELASRPSIYFSFGDGDSESTHFNGGALLDGTYQLRATGRAWYEPDLFLRLMVPASIAHESAHLWNGHVTSSDNNAGASWMHEGGAEILAWRAMRELEYLSKDEFDSKLGEAYDHCVDALRGRALMSVAKTGEHQLLYSCGAVIGRASELSLQQNGSDIFAFWRELINVAVGSKSFSQQTYFDILLEMGEDDELVAALQELVFESHGSTGDQLDKVFASVGAIAPR
jgi:hypothetical protein